MKRRKQPNRFIGLKAYLRFIAPFWPKIIFVLLIFILANVALAIIPVIIGDLVETLSTSPIDMNKG